MPSTAVRALRMATPLKLRAAQADHSLSTPLLYVMAFGILLRITVSAPMLNSFGYAWGLEGGSPISKFHPGTYLIMLAFMQWFVALPRRAMYYYDHNLSHLALILMTVFMLPYGAMTGLSGTSTFIDTYLAPALLLPLLSVASAKQLRQLTWLCVITVAINAIICVEETITEIAVYPAPEGEVGDEIGDFRGRALFDNPLAGSMASQIAIFLALNMVANPFTKVILIGAMLLGMLGYGGRLGLVTTLAGLIIIGVWYVGYRTMARKNTGFVILGALVAVITVPIAAYLVLVATPIGVRVVNSFYLDSSASLRGSAWQIIGLLSPNNLLLGTPDGELISRANQVGIYFTSEDVENCWLVLFYTLGLFGFVIYLAAFIPFLISLWRRTTWLGRAMMVIFLIIASGSNSIGRKSNVLIILVTAVYTMPNRSIELNMKASERASI